jgi:membrane-associated protease RseP (regulator of RpoE activity)
LEGVERTLAARPAAAGTPPDDDRPTPPRTPEDRRRVLVEAGVDGGLAEDILWQEGRLELDRLTLRDQAVREGWIGTDRYRDELGRLGETDRSTREQIGDPLWDRYLYLAGEDNRVRIESVIPGSAAESAGLKPGDLIESYAGERLFAYPELRDATTAGEGGEPVAVRVRRGRGVQELWVPRGPLGVRLGTGRAEPLP